MSVALGVISMFALWVFWAGGCREGVCDCVKEQSTNLASFPGLCHFQLHKECGGPGIFPHVCDVKGRKVVAKDLIDRWHSGAQNSKGYSTS